MKILVISNVYPPNYRGGYELFCKDVVEGLKSKGHRIFVLTSSFGPKIKEKDIFRKLIFFKSSVWEGSLGKFLFAVFKNIIITKRFIKKIKPDLIFCWNLRGISLTLISAIQKSKIPYCFFVDDYWIDSSLERWFSLWKPSSDKMVKVFAKRLIINIGLKKIVDFFIPTDERNLNFKDVLFPNNEFKNEILKRNISVQNTFVVGQGIDTNLFFPKEKNKSQILKLLYVGQLLKAKGIHTLIESMAILVKERGYKDIILTLVGPAVDEVYLKSLKKRVAELEIDNYVEFKGFIPREELPNIYTDCDILIFPSVWKEPFGNVLAEAMSCGLPIISTATGGNREFLKDGENAIIFSPNNSRELSLKIETLIKDESLRKRLGRYAFNFAKKNFDIKRVIDRIEGVLCGLINAQNPS